MAIRTRSVSYADQMTSLTGLVAWDDTNPAARPGILLIHGGGGLDDHAKDQALRYSALGYVVLAADMFGDGIAGDRERVMKCVMSLRENPDTLRQRGRAGLKALASLPEIDGRLAVIGFCFGGMAALELARVGSDVAGVASIHGSLKTRKPAQPGSVKARVLVCHGALDPHVPLPDVIAFAEEMNQAKADWELIMYGGAVHGFTHRHAAPGTTSGVAYDAHTDERSFAAATEFLRDVLFRERHSRTE